jgi:hypothetical protein
LLKIIKRKILIGVAVLIVVLVIWYMFISGSKGGSKEYVAGSITVTPENLPSFLASFEMINDVPKKGSIYLEMGELDYEITRGEVRVGEPSNPDIVVYMPEEYVGKFGNGICTTLREAMRNGDLYYETSLSKTELLWKYKKMMKYRDCVG